MGRKYKKTPNRLHPTRVKQNYYQNIFHVEYTPKESLFQRMGRWFHDLLA